MQDQSASIHITAPVLNRRDNLDIKDTIALIKRQQEKKRLKPEMKISLPKENIFTGNHGSNVFTQNVIIHLQGQIHSIRAIEIDASTKVLWKATNVT